MALKTSKAATITVSEYNKLHLDFLHVTASGRTDNARFNLVAEFTRYAQGADTGEVDAQGEPIYKKYWMDRLSPGAVIRVSVDDVESWAMAQAAAGNIAAAQSVGACLAAVEEALAHIASIQKPNVIGTVEVV